MKISLSFYLFAALSATVLPGCRAQTWLPDAANPTGNPTGDPAPMLAPTLPASMPPSPFEIITRVTTSEGEATTLAIDLKNASAETVELNFSSGQKFDFSATPEGEADVVWSYGMNKRFSQALSTVSLEAGKTLHFETLWKGAKPGKYLIRAVIKANGGINATPFEILVK